jgi:predicted metal-binding membrane protein
MLVMLAAPWGRMPLMVAIAVLAWLEQATQVGRRARRPSAALLSVAAVAYVAAGAMVL